MKKALSLMLVLVLVLGMSTTAFAAVKIDKETATGTRVQFTSAGSKTVNANPAAPTGNEWTSIDAKVQDGDHRYSYIIDLSGADFLDGKVSTSARTVTEKIRKDSKITIKTNVKKGSAAVDEVKFDAASTSAAQELVLVLNNELKNTNTDDGVEFEVTSYLVVDGSHWSNDTNSERVTWSGNLYNELNENVDADYDYFYMGTGVVVKPDAYIKSIELGIHEGDDDSVSVFAKLFKDKRYWAVADTDATDAQDEILDKYNFEGVYNLRNVNLAAVTNYVKLNNEDSSLFVYDGNLNLLGKGDSELPWSDVYYLSATEIETDDEIEPDDGDETDGFEDSVPGGGDDDYPENANDNPGTGC